MSERFFRAGTTKFVWVSTLAAFPAATDTEVTAGVDLSPEIAGVNGFSFTNQPIKTPDMASAFESSIPGKDAAEDSNLEMYQIKGTDPIRAALPKGDIGWMVIAFDGYASSAAANGDLVDIWPAQVASNSKMYTAENESAKYRVVFTITDPPAEEVSLT